MNLYLHKLSNEQIECDGDKMLLILPDYFFKYEIYIKIIRILNDSNKYVILLYLASFFLQIRILLSR